MIEQPVPIQEDFGDPAQTTSIYTSKIIFHNNKTILTAILRK